jgi:alkanesulfonate monooxygenase SsuD/methylene tetrahydromethanopterin reductase-like flavin-dependent oxidoreductase (luciferase family)
MKFGFHTQNNNWHNELSHAQMLDDVREQVVLSEEVGLNSVWLAEHHLNPEGLGNAPNPVLLAADLAARTNRITIGFSCVTVTIWHPLRLAEDLAALDHLTRGRIEVGFGRGFRPSEIMPFNLEADPRSETVNRELFIETMDVVVNAWTNDFFSHHGTHYRFPPKGVPHHPFYVSEEPYVVDGEVKNLKLIPKPYQQPHPPLWLMVTSERTARLAAERGYNAMAGATAPNVLSDLTELYAEIRSKREGRTFEKGEGWAAIRPLHVAATMEEARRNFETSIVRFREFQAKTNLKGFMEQRVGAAQARTAVAGDAPLITWETQLDNDLLAGSPQFIIERIASLREVTGIDYVIGLMDAGGVPHDKIMSSLELFGTRIVPAL